MKFNYRILTIKWISLKNIIFDGVRVIGAWNEPDHKKYLRCEGVENGLALGDTYPVPPCFQDGTD